MNFIKAKSVDSILSTFNTAINDLVQLSAAKVEEAAIKTSKALQLEQEAAEALTESNRAVKAAAKIKALTE